MVRLVVAPVLLKLVFVLLLNLVQYIFNIENDSSISWATLALVVAQTFEDEVILCPAGVQMVNVVGVGQVLHDA